MEKEIPIVFAVNNDYTYFGYMAIFSLIKNANTNYSYKIFVFVTNFLNDNKILLESLSNEFVNVKCVDISEYISKVTLKESLHLSIETYYRLFIPLILPKYKKIIYLDSDLCVLDDISKFYDIDVGEYEIGAIPDVPCEYLKNHSKDIGLDDCRKTFNAGVLLINVSKFEESKIREKCLEVLANDYKRKERKLIYADQDALNTVLYDNFYRIEKKWNFQWQYIWRPEELFKDNKREYFDLMEAPSIIHYAGDKKPWAYPKLPKAKIFWNLVKETERLEDIVSTVINKMSKDIEQGKYFDCFQFPFDDIPYKSKVAIYGAGVVGKDIYHQVKKTKYANIVLWVDKNNTGQFEDAEIQSLAALTNSKFDYIIIAIEKKSIAEEVKKYLIGIGVSEEVIVWQEYRKNRLM